MVVALIAGVTIIGLAAQQGPPPDRPGGLVGPGGQGPGDLMALGGFGRGLRAATFNMMLRGLRALDLTEAQRDQVKNALQSHKDEFKTIAREMIAARGALGDAATADTIDEDAIRAASGRVAEVELSAALLRARVHAEVFALLTPEQQQKAKAMREKAKGRITALLQHLLE
jgi:Spy/CpxP family protein refolding chaperone